MTILTKTNIHLPRNYKKKKKSAHITSGLKVYGHKN